MGIVGDKKEKLKECNYFGKTCRIKVGGKKFT